MPLVISDSSTLIHLTKIDRLHLLNEFYTRITIPTAVWNETVSDGQGRQGALELEQARQDGWLAVETPTNQALLRLLQHDLDRGEAEVIALAIERRADLVLLDESEARRIASLYDLTKTGVVGVLMRAKREEKLPSLQVELDKLRLQGGFWLDQKLYLQAIRAVGEEVV